MKKSQEDIRQAAEIIRDFEKRAKHLKDGYFTKGLSLEDYKEAKKEAQKKMFKELKEMETTNKFFKELEKS